MFNSIALLMTTVTIAVTPVHNLKRPQLTVPIGQIESNLNHKAKGKAGERGAFQVLPKVWGKVPKGLVGQARQHELIMDALIAENKGDINAAIIKYNSYKNVKAGKRYLAKVRLRAFEYHFIV